MIKELIEHKAIEMKIGFIKNNKIKNNHKFSMKDKIKLFRGNIDSAIQYLESAEPNKIPSIHAVFTAIYPDDTIFNIIYKADDARKLYNIYKYDIDIYSDKYNKLLKFIPEDEICTNIKYMIDNNLIDIHKLNMKDFKTYEKYLV